MSKRNPISSGAKWAIALGVVAVATAGGVYWYTHRAGANPSALNGYAFKAGQRYQIDIKPGPNQPNSGALASAPSVAQDFKVVNMQPKTIDGTVGFEVVVDCIKDVDLAADFKVITDTGSKITVTNIGATPSGPTPSPTPIANNGGRNAVFIGG